MRFLCVKFLTFLLLFVSSELMADIDMGNCEPSVVDQKLPNNITVTTKLSASKVYGIDRKVLVSNGAKLIIEPGTTLVGCSLYSYLVISKNSQIIANGTLEKPIVFTSQIDELGSSSHSGAGEWGGVVIAGNAYTHSKDNRYEADESISFGSSDHQHDGESSGILKYVSIKHTGYKVKKDKELNGLSLAGVGSGTTIKNIAIIGGKDDGIEIWGGTVNIDGLYIHNAMDDSIDVDLGYRGTIQNVLIEQASIDKNNHYDSSILEIGNDENLFDVSSTTATRPIIKNLTAYLRGGGISNKYDAGFVLDNVKMISKRGDNAPMIHFRGKDSYVSKTKRLDGNACFYSSSPTYALGSLFSKTNTKPTYGSYSAYDYFILNDLVSGNGEFMISKRCSGANEKGIWKGGAH
jgi:hypothetical protein